MIERTGKSIQREIVVLTAVIAACMCTPLLAQRDDFGGPPIHYMSAEVNDSVARLSKKVESGDAELPFDESKDGYLRAVLEELDIPISSQTLVFSKTSMQISRISPRRPRAIYFNDEVYVGYCVDGEVIEIAASDPKQGAIFYSLKQEYSERPKIERDQGQCLTCHLSTRTQDVPGYVVRSVFANAAGQPEFGSGTFTTDHKSPLKDRWGGWYVSGTHGQMRHMGNAIFHKNTETFDRESHANLTSIERLVSTKPYLSPHSDIVALMVMEHQAQMHNAITWANFETRQAIYQSETMNEALGRSAGFMSESCNRRIESAADRVLEYLLFCDEFELSDVVEGTSEFATEFQAKGIRDANGRALRDLDMQSRMFKYPCSYMIYSPSFDGLPEPVRIRVLKKLKRILASELDAKESKAYKHLSSEDRSNIGQILRETKPEYASLVSEPE